MIRQPFAMFDKRGMRFSRLALRLGVNHNLS